MMYMYYDLVIERMCVSLRATCDKTVGNCLYENSIINDFKSLSQKCFRMAHSMQTTRTNFRYSASRRTVAIERVTKFLIRICITKSKWEFATVFNGWFVPVYYYNSVGVIPVYFARRITRTMYTRGKSNARMRTPSKQLYTRWTKTFVHEIFPLKK